jgi:hypothetical protein
MVLLSRTVPALSLGIESGAPIRAGADVGRDAAEIDGAVVCAPLVIVGTSGLRSTNREGAALTTGGDAAATGSALEPAVAAATFRITSGAFVRATLGTLARGEALVVIGSLSTPARGDSCATGAGDGLRMIVDGAAAWVIGAMLGVASPPSLDPCIELRAGPSPAEPPLGDGLRITMDVVPASVITGDTPCLGAIASPTAVART